MFWIYVHGSVIAGFRFWVVGIGDLWSFVGWWGGAICVYELISCIIEIVIIFRADYVD